MKNANEPAFSCQTNDHDSGAHGLTKREYMATHILAGWMGDPSCGHVMTEMVQIAIAHADELLKQLEEKS